jgi:hypothetical protein
MSCTASAAWSRPILSLCCTKHCLYRGAVLSGRITSVAMSRSGQLDRRCTIEPHCSGLHAHLADASVMYERVLKTREPSLGQLSLSLFMWSTAHWGSWDTWQHRSSPLKKAEPGALGHVVTPELTSSGRQGPELRDTWQCQSSPQQGGEVRGCVTRGGAEAPLCREVWSEATAYVAAHGCMSYSLS